MPVKRQNHGRSRNNRGHVTVLRCDNCSSVVGKDKAIKRAIVKNLIDSNTLTDLKIASIYDEFEIPKFYTKQYFCVSCAVHARIVKVRSKEDRKIRGDSFLLKLAPPKITKK